MSVFKRAYVGPILISAVLAIAVGALSGATYPPPAWPEIPDSEVTSLGVVTSADPSAVVRVNSSQAELAAAERVDHPDGMHLVHSALVRITWDPKLRNQPCTCWMLSLATDGPYFDVQHPGGAAPLPPGQFVHFTALNFFLAMVNADSGEVMYTLVSTHIV